MTQDEFRNAMNEAKAADRLLFLTDGTQTSIALGYDSKTDEAIFFGNNRAPLAKLSVAETRALSFNDAVNQPLG